MEKTKIYTCDEYVSEVKRVSLLSHEEVDLWKKWIEDNPDYHLPHMTYTFYQTEDSVMENVYASVIKKNNEIICFFIFQFASVWDKFWGFAGMSRFWDNNALIASIDGVNLSESQLLALSGLNQFRFMNMRECKSHQSLSLSEQHRGLKIQIEGTFEKYEKLRLEGPSKDAWKRTIRYENKLSRDYPTYQYHHVRQSEKIFNILLELKQDQYSRTKVPGLSHNDMEFLIKLSQVDGKEITPFLSYISIDNQIVAVNFNIVRAGVMSAIFTVYRNEMSHYSLGRIITKNDIRSSFDMGVSILDLGDYYAYKEEFATEQYYKYLGMWRRDNLICKMLSLSDKLRSYFAWYLYRIGKIVTVKKEDSNPVDDTQTI